MTNKSIARVLKETAALVELTGGNPFRARAFSSAARTLERLETSVLTLLENGTLTDIQGIGAGLQGQIQEIITRGSFTVRDDLLNAIPPGLLDVLRIKGLGAKKVRALWQALGITSLEALEEAATVGRIAELQGFGVKSQEKILANLKLLRVYSKQRRYAEAFLQAEVVREALLAIPGVLRVEHSGALRRKMETVPVAELMVCGPSPEAVEKVLAPWEGNGKTMDEDGQTLFKGTLPDGLPLHVTLVPADTFGTLWWRQTGTKAHCKAFEERFGIPALHPEEAALFEEVGIPPIPPELREQTGELDAAAAGTLPALILDKDLKGSLHNHSTYSDGAHSLKEMAMVARAMGLSYFGICDHSRSLTIANGLSIERVHQQQEEIHRLNKTFEQDDGPPFLIFSGIESDILSDGSLDYPEEVLASFDFIVASIHSGFNMTPEEATVRLIRAVENPYTTILGHPTGRLLLAREGYPIHHEQVIEACAQHQVALELNANPYRLDLDWRWIRRATHAGVMISINPDAHAIEQLAYTCWGVAVARKGWLTREQCLNALPLDAFQQWLRQRQSEAV